MSKKIGRPTKYTQKLAEAICDEIADGKSLRTICADEKMPDRTQIFRWLRKNEDFRLQYARAKEEAVEAMIEDIVDISDDGTNDYMTITKGDHSYNVEDREVTNRSRLRVDTRKWIVSKLKPKKYGDKVDITSDGKAIKGNTIVFEDFRDEAKRK